ncbi:MAG: polysaccharide pyruvyl transferase CsaB [Ruminococcaceae bacterium]|nr:polysaccharide pyruvyl transferase CsaB [Oscillospiraceae bacterium]
MDKKLNILMTTMQMGFGGAETHIYELVLALKKNGHTVTVASAGGKYAEMLEKSGVRHVTLPLASKNPLSVVKAYRGLKKLIKKEKYDLVHAHARIPAFVCGLLQKKLNFRFVTTAHWVFKVNALWKRIANWGDKQMSVSEDIKQYLIDNYSQCSDNIFVTVNGINTEVFSPSASAESIAKELSLSNSKHRIVSISRMDESRGKAQLCLASAADKLLEKYPDLEIIIVGDGVIPTEKNLLTEVKEIATALEKKHGRKIIFTPGLRTDTPEFIAAGDIFVGASRAALEAMSVGKPTIVCGNEGYIGIFDKSKREISYKTNYCCRGCEEVSQELLIRDISALFDESNLDEKGAYCRDVILADFSAARTARDYERMYDSLSPCPKTERGDILISGYYGFENAGDDSIAASMIKNIRQEMPDAKITIFCKNPRRNAKKYGVRAIGRFNIFAMLSEMRHAKLLVSGGGNLLQNTTSSRSLFYYTSIIKLAKKCGLKIFVCANGVGPVFGKKHEKNVLATLALADKITFREPQSIEYIASLGFDTSKITLTADPALTLDSAPEERIDYIMRNKSSEKFFAVSLRDFASLHSEEVCGMNEDTFARLFASEIDKIAAKTGATPLYLIMQSSRDRLLSEKVNSIAKAKGEILENLTASEILGVISRTSLVIAMRLHLLIYGAAAGKPLVGVSYDKKVDSMLSYMGYDSPIRVSSLENGHLSDRAIKLFGEKIPCEKVDALKALAKTDAKTIIEMIK